MNARRSSASADETQRSAQSSNSDGELATAQVSESTALAVIDAAEPAAQPAMPEAQPAEVKVEEAPKPAAPTRSPAEWAQVAYAAEGGKHPFEYWQHAAAEQMHRWKQHEHHRGAPIQLTGEDYFYALVAASSAGHKPHEPAMGKPNASE